MPEETGAPPEETVEPAPGHPAVEGPETPLADLRDEAERSRREISSARERIRVLEEEAEAARRNATDLVDRAKRIQADFENFRRRSRQAESDARERAREELIRELLGILDNFDRAFEAQGSDEELYAGMKLIFKQFRSLLEKNGVERIDAEGHPFDPGLHEAVMREETTHYRDGVIIKELERGYRFAGKVIRPAKVKVAAAPENAGADPGADPET